MVHFLPSPTANMATLRGDDGADGYAGASMGIIGQAAGAQITVADTTRQACFHVNGFCLMGVELADGGPPGEQVHACDMTWAHAAYAW